jgi:hypothetical protein
MMGYKEWEAFKIAEKRYKDKAEWELLGPHKPEPPPFILRRSSYIVILDSLTNLCLLFLFFVMPFAVFVSLFTDWTLGRF